MKEVLDAYFSTLSGAEGKLTTSASKINFLKVSFKIDLRLAKDLFGKLKINLSLQAIRSMSIWVREAPDVEADEIVKISIRVYEKCITVLDSEGNYR